MTKTALVTGAARGIGLATTRAFTQEGRRVAMIDIDGPALRKAAAEFDNALVIHLAKEQAAEYGELGIRANTVAPGHVNTKLALAVHTLGIRNAHRDAFH